MPTLDLGDGMVFSSVDVLSARLNVPTSTLRRWAAEDRWPSRKIAGSRLYLFTSVRTSYDQRGRRFRDTQRRGA